MPNVLTSSILKELNIPAEKFNEKLADMMQAGLDRLQQFQHSSGGWGWFCGDADDSFMTACVVGGLSTCDGLGYEVDSVMLERGRKRLREMVKKESDLNRLAYMAFVLGKADERLLEAPETLSSYAKALLALTLHSTGHQGAPAVVAQLAADIERDHWETNQWYYKWDNVDIETTAYAIQALARLSPQSELIPPATEWLLAQRRDNHWRSTKDTAVAIATLLRVLNTDALATAVAREGSDQERPRLMKRIEVTWNGAESQELALDLNNPLESRFEAHFSQIAPGEVTLGFRGLDDLTDFEFDLELAMHLFEEASPFPASDGVAMEVAYDRPLESLRIGDEVVVTVSVQAEAPSDYVMVLSPIPAGCEVVPGSGVGDFTYFEVRYDRAIFFLRTLGRDPVTLQYRMRSSFAGSFTVLPGWAGLMYNEDIHGLCEATHARVCR